MELICKMVLACLLGVATVITVIVMSPFVFAGWVKDHAL